MFIEQKALLRSLEEMSGIIESMDRRFMLKALGSFRADYPRKCKPKDLSNLPNEKRSF